MEAGGPLCTGMDHAGPFRAGEGFYKTVLCAAEGKHILFLVTTESG